MERLRIRELREAAELTQTDLARALGVSRPAVSLGHLRPGTQGPDGGDLRQEILGMGRRDR